jgi:hypothetical protein
VWTYYYFVIEIPLYFTELTGLVDFSFVVVAMGNLVLKVFKKKKRKDSQLAKEDNP